MESWSYFPQPDISTGKFLIPINVGRVPDNLHPGAGRFTGDPGTRFDTRMLEWNEIRDPGDPDAGLTIRNVCPTLISTPCPDPIFGLRKGRNDSRFDLIPIPTFFPIFWTDFIPKKFPIPDFSVRIEFQFRSPT